MFEQIQEMVEKKIAADTKAIELQSAFIEAVAQRQTAFVFGYGLQNFSTCPS